MALNLETHPGKNSFPLNCLDVGLTILVTPKWMFVAPLTGHYTQYQGLPVYVDGYAYTGIMNIQVTEK